MAAQEFESTGFKFSPNGEYTYNGRKGREWVAMRRGDGCWLRAAACHMPLRATQDQIVERFCLLGLFD